MAADADEAEQNTAHHSRFAVRGWRSRTFGPASEEPYRRRTSDRTYRGRHDGIDLRCVLPALGQILLITRRIVTLSIDHRIVERGDAAL